MLPRLSRPARLTPVAWLQLQCAQRGFGIQVSSLRRGGALGAVLALSVILGLAVPASEAADVDTAAQGSKAMPVAGHAEPVSTTAAPAPNSPDASDAGRTDPDAEALDPADPDPTDSGDTGVDSGDHSPAEPAPTDPAPTDPAPPGPGAPRPQRELGGARAPAPAALSTNPTLVWTVADDAGTPVGGATVTMEGPARVYQGRLIWGTVFSVADCTSAPCGNLSMDQDPRPGMFEVDRKVSNPVFTMLGSDAIHQRFRITPGTAPTTYRWVTTETQEIPGSGVTPHPDPWVAQQYDFGTLVVTQPRLSCETGNLYSISSEGQLQHLRVDPGQAGAVVTSVGSPPSVPPSSARKFSGLAVALDGASAFAFRQEATVGYVYEFDVVTEQWVTANSRIVWGADKLTLVGGAVAPNGRYWAGGFYKSDSFDLWERNANGTQMIRRGRIDLSAMPLASAQGDFAFDSEGNLYLARWGFLGNRLEIFRVDAAELAGGQTTQRLRVSSRISTPDSPFIRVTGLAFDRSGVSYVGGAWLNDGLGYLTVPLESGDIPLRGAPLNTSDLGSCSFPPTVKLQQRLPDGRLAPTDQFALTLSSGSDALGEAETTGNAPGLQAANAGPIPVPSGASITLSAAARGTTALGNYASDWACEIDGTPLASGAGASGVVTVPTMTTGKEILCTITSGIPIAQKTSTPASGTVINGQDPVRYTLKFDNSARTRPTVVSYSDYLADVLDDAVFVDAAGNPAPSQVPVVATTGGITYSAAQDWDAANQRIRVHGTVPAGAVGTLSYSVRALPNASQATAREASAAATTGTRGFSLRNQLARGDAPTAPTTCAPGLCTEHAVRAWTVSKSSLPADGARLHKGGNVHYAVTATKVNSQTDLRGLVLQDDLTHVFKTAGWAPDAAVPGGALRGGVYLFDASGRSLGLDGSPNSSNPSVPRPVRSAPVPARVNIAPAGSPADMRWVVTSGAPIDVPAAAVRAELRFAVQAGERPAGIPAPGAWEGPGKTPATGWQFANYATGMAKTGSGSLLRDFAPNSCVTGLDVPNTGLAPNGQQPVDDAFPERCRTRHELSKNYFTIRKDAGGIGVKELAGDRAWGPDPTGLWNMIGQEFEIRDSVNGAPSAYPAAQLCRTTYDPAAGWNGDWIPPGSASDETLWDFGEERPASLQRIVDWNNTHPTDPRPVCATLYEIDSGRQQGRWRSENVDAGDYWLVETKAPNAQTNTTASATRPVPGVQRLAEPVPFRVWPDADGPSSGQAMHGRGQLDVGNGAGGLIGRCNPGNVDPDTGEFLPGGTIAERPTACVNPTGYLMLVKNPSPTPLPFAGGSGLWAFWGGGAAAMLLALLAAVMWRVRRVGVPRHAGPRRRPGPDPSIRHRDPAHEPRCS